MGIWLSCGHREDDFDNHHSITTKEWDIGTEGWHKALSYKTVCETCYKDHQKEGALFYSDEEAFNWLHNEKEDEWKSQA